MSGASLRVCPSLLADLDAEMRRLATAGELARYEERAVELAPGDLLGRLHR